MDTILWNVDPVVSDVKADDGVIDAIIRTDSRDDDVVPARTEVQLLELFFHGRLIETIMGILFNHGLVGVGLQFLDEFYGRTVVKQRILLAKERKFGMIFRPDGLNMNNLSIGFAETIQERSNVLDQGLHARSMSLAAFGLHIDNDQAGVLWGKLDCPLFVHENLRLSEIKVLVLLTKPGSPRQVSVIKIFLRCFRNVDLF